MTIRQGEVGGGETHVFDLVTNMDHTTYEPYVLAFSDGALIRNLESKGIKTHVIPTKIPFNPFVKKKVEEYIKKQEINIVHVHGTRAASNTIAAARKFNIPILYTVHGWSFNDNQKSLMRKLRIQSEKYIINNVDKVINVSQANQDVGKDCIKGFESVVINNGVSFKKFQAEIDRDKTRKEFGFKADEIWVGFIARLTYQKDPITTLKAIKEAVKKNDKLRLLMVGEGDMEEEVSAFIKSNDLGEVVKRLGFQSRVPEILNAIDIYTLVSRWEGLPIGLIEAMAMKASIIASDIDGIEEIITQGKNGFLVEKQNSNQLAESILELAEKPQLREKLGEAAYSFSKARFDIGKMITETESEYQKVIKN